MNEVMKQPLDGFSGFSRIRSRAKTLRRTASSKVRRLSFQIKRYG